MSSPTTISATLLFLLLATGCSAADDDTVATDPGDTAAGTPTATPAGTPGPVDLTVRREAVLPENGQMPIEGTVSTFVLRDASGAETDPRREDADGAPSYVDLAPGRYTLTSQEYLCIGSCEVAGKPAATCEQALDLDEDSRVTVRVTLGDGPCEIVAETT